MPPAGSDNSDVPARIRLTFGQGEQATSEGTSSP